MAVQLDTIVPWGRLREEYELMFNLSTQDLKSGVLDCGGGPASFTAEISAHGYRGVAVDPIYTFSGSDIQKRFEAVAPVLMSQIQATPNDWTWRYHRDADHLLSHRRAALAGFLADYECGKTAGHYVVGELPDLPFTSGAFGLAICSHLLFLYSDLLDSEFHIRAVRELCRVAGEVRIFPVLTLNRKRSTHLDAVRTAVQADGWQSDIVQVNYELQRGGNEMLRIFKR